MRREVVITSSLQRTENMEFNDISRNLFNESDVYCSLIVIEKEEFNIYGDIRKDLIVGKINDINYKVVTVEKFVLIDSEYYCKINFNNIEGYFKPLSSVFIIPKKKEQVKLNSTLKFYNELNEYLNLDKSLYDEVRTKIAYSSSTVIFNDSLYEMIVYKDEVVGFFLSSELDHLIKQTTNFRIRKNSIIYKDSSLSKQLSYIEKDSIEFCTDFVIPTKNVVRFKYENKTGWVDISSTDLQQINSKFKLNNPSDALLQSIIFQYKNKLNKSHQYYLKIINKESKGD